MNPANTYNLQNDLDDLEIAADQIEALGIDCHATADMLCRLHFEIAAVRREMLLTDAASLLLAARTFGGIA